MKKKLILLFVMLLLVAGCGGALYYIKVLNKEPDKVVYLTSADTTVTLTKEKSEETTTFVRGTELFVDKQIKDSTDYRLYVLEDDTKIYYIAPETAITEDYNQVCQETEITVNKMMNLREDKDQDITDAICTKNEVLSIDHINMERDFNKEDGTINGYMINKDGKTYYIDKLYTMPEQANKEDIFYDPSLYDDWYGEGYSKKTYIDDLCYLPLKTPEFENNTFKTDCRAVHVGMSYVYEQQDYLIDLCKTTGIDTLVLEIKSDDGRLIFDSDTARQYLKNPEATLKTSISKEEFKTLIEKYKAEGIYLIGRVVTFKDPVFAENYPNDCIAYTDGSLFIHDALEWPSAYSRTAWKYVVSYAKEAADLGLNEIQFDYVRFPDGTSDDEDAGILDFRNKYGESKSQAIQNFLYYAREELHSHETFLSADVFGWVMICGDDEGIGQFVPAVASVVDAISPMPYPDHFGNWAFGLEYPWQQPYSLQKAFTEASMKVLNTVEDPACYRSWIQGYSCLDWVCTGEGDNPERGYGADDMIDQIQGIRDAGQNGYIVWSGDGGYDMWEYRQNGFIE